MDARLPDLYFSCDVETDGPIPCDYSMLSFAFVVVASFDGNTLERADTRSFYRELKPVAPSYQQEALNVNGFDRERLLEEGADPRTAMDEAHEWVVAASKGYRPVFVAYPAVFDWMWMFWYFCHYSAHGSPFNFSDCIDVKTMLLTKARAPLGISTRSSLAAGLKTGIHTHHALDDAREQGELFVRLFEWKGDPLAPRNP